MDALGDADADAEPEAQLLAELDADDEGDAEACALALAEAECDSLLTLKALAVTEKKEVASGDIVALAARVVKIDALSAVERLATAGAECVAAALLGRGVLLSVGDGGGGSAESEGGAESTTEQVMHGCEELLAELALESDRVARSDAAALGESASSVLDGTTRRIDGELVAEGRAVALTVIGDIAADANGLPLEDALADALADELTLSDALALSDAHALYKACALLDMLVLSDTLALVHALAPALAEALTLSLSCS